MWGACAKRLIGVAVGGGAGSGGGVGDVAHRAVVQQVEVFAAVGGDGFFDELLVATIDVAGFDVEVGLELHEDMTHAEHPGGEVEGSLAVDGFALSLAEGVVGVAGLAAIGGTACTETDKRTPSQGVVRLGIRSFSPMGAGVSHFRFHCLSCAGINAPCPTLLFLPIHSTINIDQQTAWIKRSRIRGDVASPCICLLDFISLHPDYTCPRADVFIVCTTKLKVLSLPPT